MKPEALGLFSTHKDLLFFYCGFNSKKHQKLRFDQEIYTKSSFFVAFSLQNF